MLALSTYLTAVTAQLRRRWQALRATGDAGYSTEAVITIAVVAALALTEAHWVWWRLHSVRRWSHGTTEQVLG